MQPKARSQLAGLVLALLGLLTYGATSAFGLVLCLEWLYDPSRSRKLREWDLIGFYLSIPGVLFFVWLSVEHFEYPPRGRSLTGMIVAYWGGFAIWLWFRSITRWRALRNPPEELPNEEPHP